MGYHGFFGGRKARARRDPKPTKLYMILESDYGPWMTTYDNRTECLADFAKKKVMGKNVSTFVADNIDWQPFTFSEISDNCS